MIIKKNITNSLYYFFNDMINIKNFDPNLLSVDKTSFKSTDAVTCHIKCITMKSLDHVNINCENSLYLGFINVNRYIECNSYYIQFYWKKILKIH